MMKDSPNPHPAVAGPVYIGLDIGGTKLAAGVVSGAGQALLSLTVPTLAAEGGPAILRRSLGLVERLLDTAGRQGLPRPVAIGIASAGQIDYRRGTVISATDLLPGWTGLNLGQAFEQHFKLPCLVDNDVNALALGEHLFGAGRGYKDALYVAAGTGLGGALLAGGKLWRGANFCAGEIGHSLFIYNGQPCDCGRRGCLEQYCASQAIRRYFGETSGEKEAASFSISFTIMELAARASENPPGPAGQAFALAGRNLGAGLAGLIRVLDPQALIIGGGLVVASPLYFKEARAAFEEEAWPSQAAIPFLTAGLGPGAGLIGAAALCLKKRPQGY